MVDGVAIRTSILEAMATTSSSFVPFDENLILAELFGLLKRSQTTKSKHLRGIIRRMPTGVVRKSRLGFISGSLTANGVSHVVQRGTYS